ncbi:bifunctional aminoglycoside phosphotransferase/ATP-binding protein [Geobacter argillaceus]|uniref:Aminoglycoside phosphotransferase domain-containing protein n=1 Tax=Geobacter argillaceus TaxID=345631 RepID=A0A562VNG8_9BACT|nr:bifunctional aminoglycoside phosphotransferase/ATP-binding protein [Geobacter argillaceus]TWJ19445.1 hypothetical protein JN12_01861 [Geobacter argillaceus]
MDQRLLSSLLRPEAYPEPTGSVSLQQTHVSWLLFTDRFVYKIKKPVDFGFLNFTTMDRRRFYCHEEVRLNSRLSHDLYEGVIEIRETPDGAVFDGTGRVIDYAVKMHRLPAERMLDRLVETEGVRSDRIRELGRIIADFHLGAARGSEISRHGELGTIRRNWTESLEQVAPFVPNCIPEQHLTTIRAWSERFMTEQAPLFAKRLAEGFIRDCDGDLHLGNICLTDRFHIFDCIEFNERFRYIDTAADLAFLLMDLDFHGRSDFGSLLLETYMAETGDGEIALLLDFYRVYRAFVRGKVTAFRLDDPATPQEERSRVQELATAYFRLARGYLLRPNLPLTLFITCGLMGSGKSSIARLLARELGLVWLRSDRTRKELAGVTVPPDTTEDFGTGLYTPEMTEATYGELARLAEEQLRAGRSVVVDATFCKMKDRDSFRQLGAGTGARCMTIAVECPLDLLAKRLQSRYEERLDISDGRPELLDEQAATFEPPSRDEGDLIRLHSVGHPFALAEQVLQELKLS